MDVNNNAENTLEDVFLKGWSREQGGCRMFFFLVEVY
jgi:hypothetical protein